MAFFDIMEEMCMEALFRMTLRDMIFSELLRQCAEECEGREEIEEDRHFMDEFLEFDPNLEANLPEIYDVVKTEARRFMSKAKFEKQFGCVSFEKRIASVAKYFRWIPMKKKTLEKFEKQNATAKKLIEVGTDSYLEKNYEDALAKYNLAILFAEADGKELGIAYANRALVHVQLGDIQDALMDIDLAVTHNYPESLRSKLEKRRQKCHRLLKEKDPGVKKQVDEDVAEGKKFCDYFLFHISKPSALVPAADESVEIKYSKNMGRHLVVNRDVPAGTVLIVEDPFVGFLGDTFGWDTKHCYYCFKMIKRGIPCENCVFAFYCDETCKLNAQQEYHKYECNCLGYVHCYGASNNLLLAVRIICKVGPEELFRLFSSKDPDFFHQRKKPFGVQKDCRYDSRSYLTVYNLMNHANKLPKERCYKDAVIAMALTSIMEMKTNFFAGIPEDVKSEFKHFVASTILRHKEAVASNCIGLTELRGWEGVTPASYYNHGKRTFSDKVEELENVPYGAGIYPTTSLLNHSCDPNVIQLIHPVKGTVMVMTKRAVKTGEAILTQYTKGFAFQSLDRRQKILRELFHFTCQCVACKYRWPTQEELRFQPPEFCCPACSKNFTYEDKCDRNKFSKCLLQSPDWACGICETRYSERVLKEQLRKYDGAYRKSIDDLVKQNCPFTALKRLEDATSFFETHCCPPYGPWYSYAGLVRFVLTIILFTSQS